ncbi:MAG: hypothetical protein ABEJ91_00345 [Candidatus Nanohaloarchaea archaeon]
MDSKYRPPGGDRNPDYPKSRKDIRKAGENLKERGTSKRTYLRETATKYGPGIVLGALTTGVVYSSLYFMENPGDFQAIQDFLSGLG